MNTNRYARGQRLIVLLAYGLHILLIPAVAGALINALKIREYRKLAPDDEQPLPEAVAFLMTHHQWLLRTFLFSLLFLAMGSGTLYYGVGYLLVTGAVLWWAYRMLRGLMRYAGNKPMPVA